jgi:DNA-binding MarR family transcriptional regulator
MKAFNLSYAQFRVLNCIAKRGDLSQKKILEDIVVKASTLSGLLDLLEEKGFVEKKVATYDGRVRLVGLTKLGHDVWEKTYRIVMNFEEETTKHIPKEKKTEILNYLKEMNKKI